MTRREASTETSAGLTHAHSAPSATFRPASAPPRPNGATTREAVGERRTIHRPRTERPHEEGVRCRVDGDPLGVEASNVDAHPGDVGVGACASGADREGAEREELPGEHAHRGLREASGEMAKPGPMTRRGPAPERDHSGTSIP